MAITPEWVSAFASIVAVFGVFCAFGQLFVSRRIAQLQFEDGLAKEYRELASRIPTKALLGAEISDAEYESSFDEFFRYIDLSNEQVSLRYRGRISKEVWQNWCDGIKSNLALPAFKRAWSEIQSKCDSFQELHRLQNADFNCDPHTWKRS